MDSNSFYINSGKDFRIKLRVMKRIIKFGII